MPYKIEQYTKARELRREGWAIPKIAVELAVSKASVSLWVRDLPQPEKYSKEYRKGRKQERLAAVQRVREARAALPKKDRIFSGSDGRWLIRTPTGYKGTTLINGFYVYEHRYVMEQTLGRLLLPGETVHHINGDGLDNRPDNLEVLTNSDHIKKHNYQRGIRMVTLLCPTCHQEFSKPRRVTHLCKATQHHISFCSRQCIGAFDFSDESALGKARKSNVVKEYVERTKR
jgi:hypothetical protein